MLIVCYFKVRLSLMGLSTYSLTTNKWALILRAEYSLVDRLRQVHIPVNQPISPHSDLYLKMFVLHEQRRMNVVMT